MALTCVLLKSKDRKGIDAYSDFQAKENEGLFIRPCYVPTLTLQVSNAIARGDI